MAHAGIALSEAEVRKDPPPNMRMPAAGLEVGVASWPALIERHALPEQASVVSPFTSRSKSVRRCAQKPLPVPAEQDGLGLIPRGSWMQLLSMMRMQNIGQLCGPAAGRAGRAAHELCRVQVPDHVCT